MKSIKTLSLCLITASSAGAATIAVDSYDYGAVPPANSNYLDTGGTELTDGTAIVNVWGGTPPTSTDIIPLVGWQNTDPSITFNFASSVTVGLIEVWAADSDGIAAVLLPSSITVRTPDNSFTQTFNIPDPAGNGSTVKLDLTGFTVTTNALVIEPRRADPGVPNDDFIMLSEVRFDTVPEPSSIALFGLAGLSLLRRRR